ncbi:unnamed protein product, partial [Darwinula stevensoni]
MAYGVQFGGETGKIILSTTFDPYLGEWIGYSGISKLNFQGYAPIFGGCVVDINKMKLTRAKESKLPKLNWEEVSFGNHFTDYMLISNYENGKWSEPEIVPFDSVAFHPSIMSLHYGQAFFEGMKAYKDKAGDVFLFRPDKNFERMNASAHRLNMPELPKEIFLDGMMAWLDVERDWVPNEPGKALYIRPVMFASEEMILARSANKYSFIIMGCVVRDYYSQPLKVKIEKRFTRAAQGGVGNAKAAGNYAASFYPTNLAKDAGFDQIIWTDGIEHEFFEECGTMNVMVRIGDKIITPPLSDSILKGVTRDSLIQMARSKGIEVEERPISVQEVYEAHKNGTLKEVFGCGTAVVVNRFHAIGYPQETLELPLLPDDESYPVQFKKELVGIQMNQIPDPFGWRKKVEENLIEA